MSSKIKRKPITIKDITSVRKGVGRPRGKYVPMLQKMTAMRVDDSFDATFSHRQGPYAYARSAGIKVSTRVLEVLADGLLRIRVWRVK
jgi:hypothetical protein